MSHLTELRSYECEAAMTDDEIVSVRVPIGHGCIGCRYIEGTMCLHPDHMDRNCASRETQDGYERIYVTPNKAALMRLRGDAK